MAKESFDFAGLGRITEEVLCEQACLDAALAFVPDAGNPPNRARVAAAVCQKTGIQPSEFWKMPVLDRHALLKSLVAESGKAESKPVTTSAGPSSGAIPVHDARHSIDFASLDGELTDEDKAIALAVKDQGLSIADISDKLAVNRTTPYRWPKFMPIYKALQAGRAGAPPPRGSKDRDGNLEAEDDAE